MARGQVSISAAASDFAALARDLRKAGDGRLRKSLYRGLSSRTKPVIAALRDSAASTLPQRGGLAARVAGASFSVRPRSGRLAGVRITARERKGRPIDLRALDGGTVRHPLYGNRRYWYPQRVTPGWFDRPASKAAPVVRDALLDVIDEVKRELT